MHLCMYVRTYVCMYVCMYVCVCTCAQMHVWKRPGGWISRQVGRSLGRKGARCQVGRQAGGLCAAVCLSPACACSSSRHACRSYYGECVRRCTYELVRHALPLHCCFLYADWFRRVAVLCCYILPFCVDVIHPFRLFLSCDMVSSGPQRLGYPAFWR